MSITFSETKVITGENSVVGLISRNTPEVSILCFRFVSELLP